MDDRALKKVVIDAGHGGEDPGTIANGITEKDYTLKISEYIHNRLDEMGIPNELTSIFNIIHEIKKTTKNTAIKIANGNT